MTFTKCIYHVRQGKRTREGARERDKHKEPEISLKTKIQCGFMPYSESSVTKVPDDKRSESSKFCLYPMCPSFCTQSTNESS